MISFKLASGVEVIPTSFHGSKFSDGTVFEPTPEEITQIKKDWAVLTVDRRFSPVVDLPVGASSSKQSVKADGLAKLDEVLSAHPGRTIIMASFMAISALHDMGPEIRAKYARVLATNATLETCRNAPDQKIWDVNNFAY